MKTKYAKFQAKEALLLDMNSTFMFGEDRFGESEDYSEYYQSIGGNLSGKSLNHVIKEIFDYLNERYPAEKYRYSFPSLQTAIDAIYFDKFSVEESDKIIQTFSFHELGTVPQEYVDVLKKLHKKYRLALVVDIWSPKAMWIDYFQKINIWHLFEASSFSSDHGMVKPSPKPFEMVVEKLNLPKEKCFVIGDSIRRDLGGALAADIDCVLVDGSKDEKAAASFSNLLEFYEITNLSI